MSVAKYVMFKSQILLPLLTASHEALRSHVYAPVPTPSSHEIVINSSVGLKIVH